MNLQQYLLVCMAEELAEVQQEISKCLRFTPNHTPTGIYTTSNVERVKLEMADVYAITSLLKETGLDVGIEIPKCMTPDLALRFLQKKTKTEDLMKISKELGALS